MEAYKKEFIEFMVDCNVLKFGDFVTKSGRKTPFFVNTGSTRAFIARARSSEGSAPTTPRPSTRRSARTLTCSSVPPTRAFR